MVGGCLLLFEAREAKWEDTEGVGTRHNRLGCFNRHCGTEPTESKTGRSVPLLLCLVDRSPTSPSGFAVASVAGFWPRFRPSFSVFSCAALSVALAFLESGARPGRMFSWRKPFLVKGSGFSQIEPLRNHDIMNQNCLSSENRKGAGHPKVLLVLVVVGLVVFLLFFVVDCPGRSGSTETKAIASTPATATAQTQTVGFVLGSSRIGFVSRELEERMRIASVRYASSHEPSAASYLHHGITQFAKDSPVVAA